MVRVFGVAANRVVSLVVQIIVAHIVLRGGCIMDVCRSFGQHPFLPIDTRLEFHGYYLFAN